MHGSKQLFTTLNFRNKSEEKFIGTYRRLMKKIMVKMRQIVDMDRPMYDTIESALGFICK